MHASDDRILTTHIGSLPRTDAVKELLSRIDSGESVDTDTFKSTAEKAIRDVVRRQSDVGLDIINDGEQARTGFNVYVSNRMNGFDGEANVSPWADLLEFPTFVRRILVTTEDVEMQTVPAANQPVSYDDASHIEWELETFTEILSETDVSPDGTFMTAATPGLISTTLHNQYYDSHEEYVFALAEEIQTEYDRIADSTVDVIQLDSPDLLMDHHKMFQDRSVEEFKEIVRTHVEALNIATKNIADERLRIHVCWGNYEGPHHYDIDLEEILPLLYEANIGGISVELSNPRHQHEFDVFEEHPLPEDWFVYPGVIDVKTNIVEHPEVVAERIERAADVVGDPTRVIAAPDCGFGTLAGWERVDDEISWAKLETLVDGASLATERLF